MAVISTRENEPIDVTMRRFRRTCEKENAIADMKKKEAYIKPKVERKLKKIAAIKKTFKKTIQR